MKKQPHRLRSGFTLVELLVVIAILATMLFLSLLIINPVAQLNKVDDAQRRSDIEQIKNALDIYYNDHNCYPSSLPFNSSWIENNITYMRKVPQIPGCSGASGTCYTYLVPSSGSCPQWNVVFAKLTKSDAGACQLSSLSSCVPTDFNSSWACTVSGNVDCSSLSATGIMSSVSITATPTPGISNTPTPTPTPCSTLNYSCTGAPARCNVVPDGTGQYCTPACGGAC